MNFKKVLAAAVAVTLVLPSHVGALNFGEAAPRAGTVVSTDGTPRKTFILEARQSLALGRAAERIDGFMRTMQDQAVAGIQNRAARRAHGARLSAIRAEMAAYLVSMRMESEASVASGMGDSTADYADMLALVAKYKEALADARAAASGQDPYVVSAQDREAVKAEVLTWQKDLADWIAKTVRAGAGGRLVEGTAAFSFRGEGAAFSVSLSKVSALTAPGGLDQSVRFVGSFALDASGSAMPEGTGSLSAKGTFDAVVMTVSGSTFVTVNDWGVENRAALEEAAGGQVSSLLASLDKAKGLTLALPGQESAVSGQQAIAWVAAMTETLRTVPSFSPTQKRDGKFLLAGNPEFAAALSKAAGNPDYPGVTPSRDERPFLWLTKDQAGAVAEGSQDGMSVRAARSAAGLYDAWMKSDDGSFEMAFSGGSFSLKAGGSPYFDADVVWKDGRLDASLDYMGTAFSASGALTAQKADLKISVAAGETPDSPYASARPAFGFDVSYDLTDRPSGATVTAPTDAVDASEFFAQAAASAPGSSRTRDLARKSGLQQLATGLETYYTDYGSYPEKIDVPEMRDYFKGAKFPYVAPGPNGECSAPFTVRIGSTRGLKNNSYVLSTCVENAASANGKLDKSRFELRVDDAPDSAWGPEQKVPAEKPAVDALKIRSYTAAGSRDAARKSALQSMQFDLEVFAQRNGAFPADAAAASIALAGGKAPATPDYPGGTMCRAPFSYQAGKDAAGAWSYRLSVCLEDPKGAGADQDGGQDPLRFERYATLSAQGDARYPAAPAGVSWGPVDDLK